MTPVRIRQTITDIHGTTLEAGTLAWIRRAYQVNGGTGSRVDLEDSDGNLRMNSVPPDCLEHIQFKWEHGREHVA